MQVVIPMSGFGERFRAAGYVVPKPLITVEGKPIIAHVIDLFPGETDFIFVCNQEHLDTPGYRMAETLHAWCPTGRIAGIAPHRLGPVHAVLRMAGMLDPARPVVVNYCDFTCLWDWRDFKQFVAETGCAGAIPAYRGFHPHSLGSTFYAYVREHEGWVTDIQEKQPFTGAPINEYASSGTYYFATAQIMLDVFQQTVAEQLQVNGEYYVSLVYKILLRHNLPVAVYRLQHFMQWGTPQDLADYERWSDAFRQLSRPPAAPCTQDGMLLVPMAGLGKRFSDAGYALPKPLIPVSGRAMAVQAAADLPVALQTRFVIRQDLPNRDNVVVSLRDAFPAAALTTLEGVTDGQARSCVLALNGPETDAAAPLTIGTCDNGQIYDTARLRALLNDPTCDVIVWVVRGHPEATRKPHMFGWIAADASGHISGVSVKVPLTDPATDPVVTGTFTFKRAGDFLAAAGRMFARHGLINGEYYVDSCITDALALGLQCRAFEIDHYLGWGTPDDLMTFEYWQSCFHQWPSHPYRLELDWHVPPAAVAGLAAHYALAAPPRPIT